MTTQAIIKKGQKSPSDKTSKKNRKSTSRIKLWMNNLEKNLNPYGIIFLCLVISIVQTILYKYFPSLAIPKNMFKLIKFYEHGFMVQYLCTLFIDMMDILIVVCFIALIAIAIWTLVEVGIILYCIIATFVVMPIVAIIMGFLNVIGVDHKIGIDIAWDNKMTRIYEKNYEEIEGTDYDIPWFFRILLLCIIGGVVVLLNWQIYLLIFRI